MPNRLLKEGICTSDAINMLSSDSEVLFYRLLVVADDFGRMDGRVQIIKSQCFPLKDSFTPSKIEKLLVELQQATLITSYQVNNKPFFIINKWEQRVRSKEKYPAPQESIESNKNTFDSNLLTDDSEAQTCDSDMQTDDRLGLGLGKGRGMGKGIEETHTTYPSQQSSDLSLSASVCIAIKKIGIIDINQSHPEFIELLRIGATIDEFMHAARTAKDKKSGFAYMLGIVKKQRERALELKGKLLIGTLPELTGKTGSDHGKYQTVESV
ncbi:hypothetical protein [Nitrosomonas sp.]|uniref:hypothetical protein n=1 Tax=Nitrosomonas sp. TaxID=42353 RepID=UPI0025FBB7D6|nr:hypothetical protein [Nitrosomonas sp.]